MVDHTRRRFLSAGVTAGLAGIAGCSTRSLLGATRDGETSDGDKTDGPAAPAELTFEESADERDPLDVRGAIYVPARAFNVYQQWADYDHEVVERDLGYATEVNLNAIRAWASFEFWEEAPEAHAERLDHFLSAADDRDLSVVLSLFDFAGKEPSEERLRDTDPRTATGVKSPASSVMKRKSRWDAPMEYVGWAMERYGDDDRLLALEAMNEPGWTSHSTEFARGVFETMADDRGSVALTVGSTSMANNAEYLDWGSDALQFHYNFAESRATYREMLESNRAVADELDAPVWLSEWQRVREATGFAAEPPDDQKGPNYASLAPLVHEAGFGSFFWSLMVKPAFVPAQRKHGVLNGLFHEDGTVYSAEDARAIAAMSGEASFDGEERREWPEWAAAVSDGT
ncbi:glycoside hydrolase [Halorussus salilacus]|uniref:glycoside hydrolase n=1 Tax=Halorussus salilacus TaxID=2953750 RepID=UPI00209ECBE0|nr:glycoside hydrolase [Halorussus salilacus]USZ68467.1 glycoside hydrolase [Halorussus salilacus]